jgi:hypothetical protein
MYRSFCDCLVSSKSTCLVKINSTYLGMATGVAIRVLFVYQLALSWIAIGYPFVRWLAFKYSFVSIDNQRISRFIPTAQYQFQDTELSQFEFKN